MTRERRDILTLLQANLSQNRLPEAAQLLANLHPAVSYGPFVTITNDISGIVIYLSISSAFLKYIAP